MTTRKSEYFVTTDPRELAFIVAWGRERNQESLTKFGMLPSLDEDDDDMMRFAVINTAEARQAREAFLTNDKIGIQSYLQALEKVMDRLMNAKRALRHGRSAFGTIE